MGAVEKQNETFVIKLRSYCFVIEYLIYRFNILKSQYIEYLKCSYSLTLQTHLVGVFLFELLPHLLIHRFCVFQALVKFLRSGR